METSVHSFTSSLEFDHKGGKKNAAFGRIAAIAVTASATVSIDGKECAPKAVEYLINYGIRQSLGDSYASADSLSKAVEMFDKRLARVISGSVAARSVLTPFDREFRKIAESKFAEQAGMTYAKFEESMGEETAEAIWLKFIEANGETFAAEAERALAQLANLETKLSVADLVAAHMAEKEAAEGEESKTEDAA